MQGANLGLGHLLSTKGTSVYYILILILSSMGCINFTELIRIKIKVLLLNCLVHMHKRVTPKIRSGLGGIYFYQKGYSPMCLLKDRGIGSALVTHLSLTNSRFCGFILK